MRHSHIALAAALLGLATAAQAQMTLYGLIDMSYGKSIAEDVANRKADFHSGGDNGSGEGNSTTRVGMKGSTDVGSGVKMNFKLETGGITSNGEVNPGGAFFNRQAWLGASGGFGEVRLGRQDSVPFQLLAGYDFNGASNGISSGGYTGVGVWARGRQSRSLQYILPTLAKGLVVQAGLVPKGNGPAGTKDVLSAGARFETGAFSVGGAVQSKGTSAGKDFASVAGTYALGPVKFMLGYADGGKVAQGGSGSGPSAGVTATFGSFTVGGLYAQNADNDAKSKGAEVWVSTELFKSTYGYVEAGQFKPTGGSSATGYAAGVIFVF
jgi:predicted porin